MFLRGRVYYVQNNNGRLWAKFLNFAIGTIGPIGFHSPPAILVEWYRHSKCITNTVVFRVVGNGNCQNDTFSLYNDPDPNQDGWMDDQIVFDINNP